MLLIDLRTEDLSCPKPNFNDEGPKNRKSNPILTILNRITLPPKIVLTEKRDETDDDAHDETPHGDAVEGAGHELKISLVPRLQHDAQEEEDEAADEGHTVDEEQEVLGHVLQVAGHGENNFCDCF